MCIEGRLLKSPVVLASGRGRDVEICEGGWARSARGDDLIGPCTHSRPLGFQDELRLRFDRRGRAVTEEMKAVLSHSPPLAPSSGTRSAQVFVVNMKASRITPILAPAFAFLCGWAQVSATGSAAQGYERVVTRFNTTAPPAYRAFRRLEAGSPDKNKTGWLEAWTCIVR